MHVGGLLVLWLLAGLTFARGDESKATPTSNGIWISKEELRRLPTEGPTWAAVLNAARHSIASPTVSDGNSKTDTWVLAKAYVYVRTNEECYRQEVIRACEAIIGTEDNRTLDLGRELPAYVIAADLVELPKKVDGEFRRWLMDVRTRSLDGKTLVSTHEQRPNNWGTHCGGARVAIAAYLEDDAELDRCAQILEGWLGNRDTYSGFVFGDDLSWHANAKEPVGINPKNSKKEGRSIDGVIPDDQRRGGSFSWPPPHENYAYEALQGILVQAVILSRRGFDVFEWEDKALLRAFTWLNEVAEFPAEADDTWQAHVINHFYGSRFDAPVPSRPGKNVGFTDWTHPSK